MFVRRLPLSRVDQSIVMPAFVAQRTSVCCDGAPPPDMELDILSLMQVHISPACSRVTALSARSVRETHLAITAPLAPPP